MSVTAIVGAADEGGGGRRPTVEQVLIISLVIQVATVLLDGIHAKLRRVDGLGAQVVGLEVAADDAMALLVGSGLGPLALDGGTLGDKVPLGVGPPGVLLWLGQGRQRVEGVGGEQSNLVPESLGFVGHGAKGGLVVLDLIGPGRGGVGSDLLDPVGGTAKDLLRILLEVDGGGSADQQS